MDENNEEMVEYQHLSTHELLHKILNMGFVFSRVKASALWRTLLERVQKYPEESRREYEYGMLPIHVVLKTFKNDGFQPVVVKVVQALIEAFPESLVFQSQVGYTPLYVAAKAHNFNKEYFREVLFRNIDAARIPDKSGEIPLHQSVANRDRSATIYTCWELLWCDKESVKVKNSMGLTALEVLVEELSKRKLRRGRQILKAKLLLVAMAFYHHCVPEVPDDETIEALEFNRSCGTLARKLRPGQDEFALHEALSANMPMVIINALMQIPVFRVQMDQPYPETGQYPIETALLNLARDGTLD